MKKGKGAPKAKPQVKKGSKKILEVAKEAKEVEAEDWLGEASDDEDKIGDTDSDAETGHADEGSEEEAGDDNEVDDDGEDGTLAVRDEDADEDQGGVRHKSKVLARVISGEQPADLSQIKQRIHDAAAMLGDWRKAKQLGDKRTREEVLAGLVGDCSTYFGYSEELAEYFLRMFSPEQAIQFFEANEKSRPLTIRTNSLKARRQSLMQALTARKVQVDPIGAWTKVGLKVYESAVPVGATPEYLGGQYMIQSASSFVPVMALAPQMNEVVLDMAAAPGGKTTYIGQLMKNTGTLFANDLRKERCKALVANVHRMGLTNVIVTCLDGKKLGGMLPKLDRVLLDAPCSGSGIIARDPSVKVKRGAKDFEQISGLQKELLNTAIDMVDANSKTGGYVVYSTCSVSVEENEAVVEHALKTRSVELVSFSSAVNFGVEGMTRFRERRFHPTMGLCRRYYPHVHNMDGFFVAKFKKTSNTVPERAKKDRSKMVDHIQNWGEEHWTPAMMETVVDFPEPGSEEAAEGKKLSAKGKLALNKRERKKIKRAAQISARATAAGITPEALVAAAAAGDKKVGEPEEEPQPPAKVSAKRAKILLKKKMKAGKEEAKKDVKEAPKAEEAAGKKRKLVSKKASAGEAAESARGAEEGGKKKRRKST